MRDLSTDGTGATTSKVCLVARARSMDPAAWAEIYSSHHAFIHRYVRSRVFDEATAQDLTSTTFVAALQGIGSYRERGRPLLAGLYTIARNKVADHQRQAVAQRHFTDRASTLARPRRIKRRNATLIADQGSSDADPGASVERLDLRSAIALLPEAQREVLILRHFVGLSTPEIAAAMRKKAPAIYSVEARALASLREKLAGLEEISAATDEKHPYGPINRQMEPMVD